MASRAAALSNKPINGRHAPPHLPPLCSCCLVAAHAQRPDTLTPFYPSDGYRLSATAKGQLDGFLKAAPDRLSIRIYTDETDADDDNLQLSKRRADEVYRYFLHRNMPAANMAVQYVTKR